MFFRNESFSFSSCCISLGGSEKNRLKSLCRGALAVDREGFFLFVRRLPFLSAGAVFLTAFLVPFDATILLVGKTDVRVEPCPSDYIPPAMQRSDDVALRKPTKRGKKRSKLAVTVPLTSSTRCYLTGWWSQDSFYTQRRASDSFLTSTGRVTLNRWRTTNYASKRLDLS